MANCTWEGCTQAAKHPCIARDGKKWADLCDDHKARFDEAPSRGSAVLLGVWVKAQGGSKVATARMLGTSPTAECTSAQEQAGADAYKQWKANVGNESSSAYGGNLHDLARRIFQAMVNAAPREASAEAASHADGEARSVSKAEKAAPVSSTTEDVLRAELHRARASYAKAVEILTGIYALLNPPLLMANGKTYSFENPRANETLQALSDAIRAIPEELRSPVAPSAKEVKPAPDRNEIIEECARAVEDAKCLPSCYGEHADTCPVVFPGKAIRALKK